MTYPESPRPIVTHRGKVENKAPHHYISSKKSQSTTTLAQPLVAVDPQFEIKTVEKAIKPRNPIEEIKNIRNRYQGEYAIIRETMQNSERIGRDRNLQIDIIITITPDKFKIEDNGGGVTKGTIDAIFNLGESGYKQLDESTGAFGQGFMSFILLFNKAEVVSNDINAEFDWARIEAEYNKNKNFDLSKAYTAQEASSPDTFDAKDKFIAIFTKPVESYNYQKAIEQAKIYAKTLPVRSITINNESANNRVDFSYNPPGFTKVEKPYKNIMGIEGYFAPATEDDCIRLYFQGLPVGAASSSGVDNYFYKLPSMTGDVNINTTFYGRPSENRDSWIMDTNIEKTINILRELAKLRAIDLIKYASQSIIEKHQHFISSYTTFEDILYHIRFEVVAPEVMNLVSKSERSQHPELNDKAFDEHMKQIIGSQSKLNEAIERAKGYSDKVDTKSYNEREQEILKEKQRIAEQKIDDSKLKEIRQSQEQVLKEENKQIQEEKTTQQEKTHDTKQQIDEFLDTHESGGLTCAKWVKETFWVERDMVMVYMNEISSATYHRIPLSFAENKYQKKLFQQRKNFHYISELKQLVTNTAKLASAGAHNSKERRIEYIMKVFIDAAGYPQIKIIIANIDFKTVIQIPYSNTKIEEPMEVAAYAEGNSIYFHRKLSYGNSSSGEINGYYGIESLYPFFIYNDFDLENKSIGQGDIAIFSKIRKLLAHEMAHVIYHTTDNTDTHFKAMLEIDSKFDKVISEFKSSSVLTNSHTGIKPKTKKLIGLTEGDNVVVTYTKGSHGELEKQEYVSPKTTKYSKKDIFYNDERKRYYTYEELLLKSLPIDQILQFNTPIGYKLGDYVSIKTTESTAFETHAATINGELIELTLSGMIKIKFDDGYTDIITHNDIIAKVESISKKYHDSDILYDDSTQYNSTWSQIKRIASDYGKSVEDYLKYYKPTGLRVHDKVEIHGTTGNIQVVEKGVIIFYGDDGEIETITNPSRFTKLQPTISPTPEKGKMLDMYNQIKAFLASHPNSTQKEIINGVSSLASYGKPQNYLWNVLKKYGQNEIEYNKDRPQKLKLKNI